MKRKYMTSATVREARGIAAFIEEPRSKNGLFPLQFSVVKTRASIWKLSCID
ncbi:hypothetical protein SAMN05216244_1553 [Sediminibacillus halophilus]|uniref:Uncharacterized protein n=1 Tax=Sediminibacillus halophilus TaxID=482461 RepID=A0A1G9PSQ0_9BACI|nr:hypothetical protein SAMN05216244_1553 [Sediminibacillus halophilus]